MSIESSLPNKRAEWDACATETQAAINELLEQLGPEIREINQQLSDLCDHGEFALAQQLAHESLVYFNSQWPYTGDHFYVSGSLYTANIGLTVEGLTISHAQNEVTMPMRSAGFLAKSYSDTPGIAKVRIGYSFVYGDDKPIGTVYGHIALSPRAYADVDDEFSLLYLRPDGEEVVSGDHGQIIDRIERARAMTDLYLHDPRSSFYDASADKQQKFFFDTAQLVEEALPNPDAFDHLAVQVETNELSWKGLEGSLQTLRSTQPEVTYQIAGTALGATSRNLLPDDELHRFTSPDDLVDEKGDICLIIEPVAANFPLTPGVLQEFIIPVTSAKNFKTKLV